MSKNKVKEIIPKNIKNLIQKCNDELIEIYDLYDQEKYDDYISKSHLREQPLLLMSRMIGLSFEIFEDNEKDVWRQVAKEKDDFSPIHKKFIAKLLNANSETYKFWKAFGEAFICNAKIHNPFSISDITEILSLLKDNNDLKTKFKEFLIANRILPSSSKRHIELKSNLELYYSGAIATIDEREIDTKKISEKYRNTVFKSLLLIHGIKPSSEKAYQDQFIKILKSDINKLEKEGLVKKGTKGEISNYENLTSNREEFIPDLSNLSETKLNEFLAEHAMMQIDEYSLEEATDYKQDLNRCIFDLRELISLIKKFSVKGTSFDDIETMDNFEQSEWRPTSSINDFLVKNLSSFEGRLSWKNEFGNDLTSLFLNSLSYLLKSLESRNSLLWNFDSGALVDHESLGRVIDAKNIRTVSNELRKNLVNKDCGYEVSKINASRSETSWYLNEEKKISGKSRSFVKDFYLLKLKDARNWVSAENKRIGYRELSYVFDKEMQIKIEDLEFLYKFITTDKVMGSDELKSFRKELKDQLINNVPILYPLGISPENIEETIIEYHSDSEDEDHDIYDIAPEEYDATKEGIFDVSISDSNLGKIKSIIQKIETYEYLNKKLIKN